MKTNSRENAILLARKILEDKPVFLDTETTGLSDKDEIVEISIVDSDGKVLVDELVKPSKAIPRDAEAIHHISNEMVQGARSFPIAWQTIRPVLINRNIGIYNAPFDLRMLKQSMTIYNFPWNENLRSFDVMEIYARYRNLWDPIKKRFKFHSLDSARAHFNLSTPNSHRAKDDTLLTREVLIAIANSN